MADRKIGDLVSAEVVKDNDLLIMEQDGVAKNMSGAKLLAYLDPLLKENADRIFENLHQVTKTSLVKNDSTITITTTLDDGAKTVSIVTVDDNGYPSKIVTDGVECTVSWEGFDA
jgi:hypothetical protein